MRADLTVFAKDYPESRLMAEVKPTVSTPPEQDPAIKQLMRYMWGENCHYGLLVTPITTYVLRDDFSTSGPESIRITNSLSTETLFSRLVRPVVNTFSERELEMLTGRWLSRLASSYESALPDDAEVTRAFFPEIVGAVADGRVVSEALIR
ncbi:MAG TPA: hypothetical protein VN688_07280 [Gemmataceae bacterium]|nr:hypothetical protein [Gemmataceae bacterium]